MPNIDRNIDRWLATLRTLIRDQGLTQLEVQEALGWGRSYISQLFTRQKSLRVEQVLLILNVIDIQPNAFFAEVYQFDETASEAPHGTAATPLADEQAPVTLRSQLDSLDALIGGLVSLLERQGILTATTLARAIEKARKRPLPDL